MDKERTEPKNKGASPLHYGWVVMGTSMFAIFAALGLGRFALGMILPGMGADLGLSYAEMGMISTANFVGYLVSVLASGWLATRHSPSRVIWASLLLVAGSMALMGAMSAYLALAALYFLTGIGSGGANIPTMGLVSAWFSRTLRGRAAGFIVIGSGFAIIVAGRLVPWINAQAGASAGWRVNWLVLGGAVALVALLCRALMRDRPAEMGLTPVGAASSPPRVMGPPVRLTRSPAAWHLGTIYFLFGATYSVYVTFFVTSLVQDRGMTEADAGAVWVIVGLLSLLSGPVFGVLSDRLGRRVGFAIVFTLQCSAYVMAAMGAHPALLYASAACYGLGAWSIPGIMAAAVGDHFGATRAPQVFGFVTSIFALGQVSGPYAAGLLADSTGSFSASFIMIALMASLAIALSLTLKPPQT